MKNNFIDQIPENQKLAWKIFIISILINVILFIIKLTISLKGGSYALFADSFHSLSDGLTDILMIAGIIIASKPVDRNHHYGHGKFETLSSVLIGVILFFTAMQIGKASVVSLWKYIHYGSISSPENYTIIPVIITVISKEWLYHYTVRAAEKTGHESMKSNAWHHRTDSFSSIIAGIGILLTRLPGDVWSIFDPIASLGIIAMLMIISLQILSTNINELLEASLPKEEEEKIINLVNSVPGVHYPHRLRTRRIGKSLSIEIHIRVRDNLTVSEGHRIASDVEKKLRNKYGEEVYLSIHTEPLSKHDSDSV